jgi:REP element-mobilizing transposase RayT
VRKDRLGAHTKSDLKVPLVWVPKYREPVLTGEVAIRVRDLIRQIAREHELQVISGQVARDHVHVFLSYRPHQDVSQIMQWLKGIQLPGTPSGVSESAQEVLGPAFLGTGVSGGQFRQHHRRNGQGVYR